MAAAQLTSIWATSVSGISVETSVMGPGGGESAGFS
jgi:hypothetical protein